MGFLFGDAGAMVFILFAGFALGVVFGWSLLEGRWSGGGGDGRRLPGPVGIGRPVRDLRVTREAGMAEVIPLRPTGSLNTQRTPREGSSAERPPRG